MNFRQLEYFVAVAELLNFTKAAKKCYISQTAMSLQIQSLEEKVGVPLFLRDKHHVELTAAGKIYYQECKAILSRLEDATKLALTASEGFSGTLHIGFIRGYEYSHLSGILKNFHSLYPNISLRFTRDNMSALYTALEEGKCDIIYNLSTYSRPHPETVCQHFLKEYPLLAVMSTEHPFASRFTLTYRDLKDSHFVIMQPEGRPIEETEEALLCYHRGGFFPHIVSWEREVHLVILEASIGAGIAILPEYALRLYRNTENLSILPLVKQDGSAETVNFALSWKTNHSNPAIDKYLEWLQIR